MSPNCLAVPVPEGCEVISGDVHASCLGIGSGRYDSGEADGVVADRVGAFQGPALSLCASSTDSGRSGPGCLCSRGSG